MATKVEGVVSKIQLPDNNTEATKTNYAIASTAYGYCQTAAGTAAKVVDMTGFSLVEGITIHIKFQYANSASNPTLNVNGTGAKAIMQYGTTAAGGTAATTGWQAGAMVTFTYDGTNWIRDQGYNTNSTYSVMGDSEFTTGTATSGRTMSAARLKESLPKVFSTGTTNGTFKVYNTEISVAGLGSNAFTSTTYAPLDSPALTGSPTAPTAANGTNTTQIATTAFVMNAFAANDAMIYKGTIGTNGTITELPTTHEAGWTYKVITAGTYAEQTCEIGDMIICITDGSSANNAHWSVIQNNIDGAVIGPVSSTTGHIATFSGDTGKVIQDSNYTIDSLQELFLVNVTLSSVTAGTSDKTSTEIKTALTANKLPVVSVAYSGAFMLAPLTYVDNNCAVFTYEHQNTGTNGLYYCSMSIQGTNVSLNWRGQYLTQSDIEWGTW